MGRCGRENGEGVVVVVVVVVGVVGVREWIKSGRNRRRGGGMWIGNGGVVWWKGWWKGSGLSQEGIEEGKMGDGKGKGNGMDDIRNSGLMPELSDSAKRLLFPLPPFRKPFS